MSSATSEATDLVVLSAIVPAAVFVPGGADDLLAKLEAEVRAVKTDISTPAGRKAIASLAYKVARSKTALDEMGKTLTADLKAKTAAVDAERRIIWDRIEALQLEVRKPLTDWENAEKARVEAHEDALDDLTHAATFTVAEPSIEEIDARLAFANRELATRDWQEFAQRAREAAETSIKSLTDLRDRTVKREAERAELERLLQEEAARKEQERLAEIARQAAEKARREAEEKAAAEARAAEERAAAERKRVEKEAADKIAAEQAERQRVERERQEAEARAAKAEADRKAAEKRAADEAKAAAEQAERDRQAALAKAERDRVAAVEAERKRAADAKAREEAEAAKREANKRHAAKINGQVLNALMAAGLTEEQGKLAVTAIAKGLVPHTKITY